MDASSTPLPSLPLTSSSNDSQSPLPITKGVTGVDELCFPKFLVFDPLYLFTLSFLYLFRFAVTQRFVDPRCISTFASLHSLIPEIKGDVIMMTSVDSMNTAECISSYKLLRSALRGICDSPKEIGLARRWKEVDDQKAMIFELLNVAISKKGEGMTRAVTYPRTTRMDQNV